ncbi:MAG: PH domain-containing protein [Stellaceae bacterium]
MGYVERVLQPDEQVIDVTHIHWWFVWRRTALFWLIAVGCALAGEIAATGTGHLALFAAAALAFLIGLVLLIRPAIERATTELAVTSRRVIHKRGLIQRHTVEMSRSQVESVDVDQSILGRLLNFGDIVVHGTGSSPEPFRCVADPLRFRSAITAG